MEGYTYNPQMTLISQIQKNFGYKENSILRDNSVFKVNN